MPKHEENSTFVQRWEGLPKRTQIIIITLSVLVIVGLIAGITGAVNHYHQQQQEEQYAAIRAKNIHDIRKAQYDCNDQEDTEEENLEFAKEHGGAGLADNLQFKLNYDGDTLTIIEPDSALDQDADPDETLYGCVLEDIGASDLEENVSEAGSKKQAKLLKNGMAVAYMKRDKTTYMTVTAMR